MTNKNQEDRWLLWDTLDYWRDWKLGTTTE